MRRHRGKSGPACRTVSPGRPVLYPPAGPPSRRLCGICGRARVRRGADAGRTRLRGGVRDSSGGTDRLSGRHGRAVRKAGRDGLSPRRLRQSRPNCGSHRQGAGAARHRLEKRAGKGVSSFRRRGIGISYTQRKTIGKPCPASISYSTHWEKRNWSTSCPY